MSTEVLFPLAGRRVWVAGHAGMVGSAIVRRLQSEACEVLTVGRRDLDLRRQEQVESWMATTRPEVVVLAAAKVGGILGNDSAPVDFLYDNLMIEANVIATAHRVGVEKLLFLGSSCIYPKASPQPIPEGALLTGPLEPTNQWYAIAKIAGLRLCEAYRRQFGCDFITAMPTNLYGPGDSYDLETSHVIPALLRKAHEAKLAGSSQVEVWGSGAARREFLHADDCADACVHLLKTYSAPEHVNVGSGQDLSILELATLVCEVVGFRGAIQLDPSKPDGTPRKLLDCSKLYGAGWRPRIPLRAGLADAYAWFLANQDRLARRPAAAPAAHPGPGQMSDSRFDAILSPQIRID